LVPGVRRLSHSLADRPFSLSSAIKKKNFVIVSGIGLFQPLSYYMNTYGFHTIHGRAPAVATGLKPSPRPGSLGGPRVTAMHFHRRNQRFTCCAATSASKVLLFNNKIYGPHEGQYSASELNKKRSQRPSAPWDRPFNPVSLAIGSEATFFARSVDVYPKPLEGYVEARRRAQRFRLRRNPPELQHLQRRRGFNLTRARCPQRTRASSSSTASDDLRKNRDKGIVGNRTGRRSKSSRDRQRHHRSDLIIHTRITLFPSYAFQLLPTWKGRKFPTPIGVFRALGRRPRYEDVHDEADSKPSSPSAVPADLAKLLRAGDTWEVK